MLGDRRLWATALIICACVGLFATIRHFKLERPVFDDPDASLRQVAGQHLGKGEELNQLRAVLKSLPRGGHVVVFGSSTDWGSSEVYLLTSYLHWPHSVWFVNTGDPAKVPALPHPPEAARENSVLFFYGLEPPPSLAGNVTRIGPKLAVAMNTTAAAQQ